MLHCEPTRSPQYVASSLSLDMEYLFLVGSSGLLSMAVQQLVAILIIVALMRTLIAGMILQSHNVPLWAG